MESSPEQTRRIRVLVVDDDREALAGLTAVLSDDYDVRACQSPRQALDLARTEDAAGRPFEVVCSDFRMPEMDGGELLRRVSELPEPPGCVLVTGYVEVLTGKHRSAEHIFGIVVKPYDPGHLIGLVGRLGRVTRMNRSMKRLATRAGRRP
jgi:DNA-binding NtrC family response regulator